MIATGLDWKMAIGACVLGNTIMGLVITVNGRIGATVSRPCLLHQTSDNVAYSSSCMCRFPFLLVCHLDITSATLLLCLDVLLPSSGLGESLAMLLILFLYGEI